MRFALGINTRFVFYYSVSIWLSVLFHFLYNGLQVTALYMFNLSGAKNQKDIEDNFPLWAGVVALFFIIYLFTRFRKISLAQKAKIVGDDFPEDDFHNWATAQS